MKWNSFKNSEVCFVNDDNTVMKANDLKTISDSIPNCIFNTYSINDESNIAHLKIGTLHYIHPSKGEQEVKAVMLTSNNAFSFFAYPLFKKFMQKSSKYYVGNHFYPSVIENKNYTVLIAPLSMDQFDYRFIEDN